ncbi:LysR family transcriptional regulator [Streptomyces sp. NPDC004520]|uniref:helix-turn-helix domain-containing protein n=1 Tax=Streptomyces sp. NPDC004520 TaxID=3364702 RepID=UPI00367CB03F
MPPGEELRLGRTAERLHVTAARDGQAIRKQERHIGGELFARTRHHVRSTPRSAVARRPAPGAPRTPAESGAGRVDREGQDSGARLEADGVIRGYRAVIEPAGTGRSSGV